LEAKTATFLPVLAYIINELETICDHCEKEQDMPRRFSLTPQPGLHWRHVHINNKALQSTTKVKGGNSYEATVRQFNTVFNFKRLGFDGIDDLLAENTFSKFACYAATDGFGISFGFARKAKGSGDETRLELDDFDVEEVEKYFLPMGVDPGRTHIFTSTIRDAAKNEQVRRCSSKERACYVGTKRRSKHTEKLKKQNGIKTIEDGITSPKTVRISVMEKHVQYMLDHLDKLFLFNNERSAPFIFYAYQGRQRANAEMANILIDGGKKYCKRRRKCTKKNRKKRRERRKNRRKYQGKEKKEPVVQKKKKKQKWPNTKIDDTEAVPLIVFGDGMRNKDTVRLKGHISGTTGVLYRELVKRSKVFDCALVDINEYKTSKVCNSCKNTNLKGKIYSEKRWYRGILDCKSCSILWNRDVCASKNMMDISSSIWRKEGRPSEFRKNIAGATPVSPQQGI
jgi:hypothetical protein